MAERLNSFVRHYEPLLFSNRTARRGRSRSRRAADTIASSVGFTAFGRDFQLILQHDTSSFAKDLITVTSKGTLDMDLSHLRSGKLAGDPESRVFGSLTGLTFEGRITTGDGSEYYVEPGRRYFGNAVPDNYPVIYMAEDVELPRDVIAAASCGINRIYDLQPPLGQSGNPLPTEQHKTHRYKRSSDYLAFPAIPIKDKHAKNRSRAIASPYRRLCNMEIAVDHTLYKRYQEDGGDDATVRERIASTVASHINEISYIFGSTNFGDVTGVRFVVQSLKVNDTLSCDGKAKVSNPYCSDDLDADGMLSLLSDESHDGFCLSYILTYRDFSHGTLGLAYVAYPDERAGGICEKYRTVQVPTGFQKIALNTGVITLLNHGKMVPTSVSMTTFAHEVGHSFGSAVGTAKTDLV